MLALATGVRVDRRVLSLARLDKEQGPVIRWRDDFLIIAPSSEPGGLVAVEASRLCVHTEIRDP